MDDCSKPSRLRLPRHFDDLRRLRAGGEGVELKQQGFVDRLFEMNLIDLPNGTVGEDYPFHAIVRAIVDRLLDMIVLEGRADGLRFDEKPNIGSNSHSQIDVGSPD